MNNVRSQTCENNFQWKHTEYPQLYYLDHSHSEPLENSGTKLHMETKIRKTKRRWGIVVKLNREKQLSPDALALKHEQNEETKPTKSTAYKFNHIK